MPLIPAEGEQRQADISELKSSLIHMASSRAASADSEILF